MSAQRPPSSTARSAWVVWLACAGLAGCAASAPHRTAAPEPPALPPEIAAYYDYPDHHPHATLTLVRTTNRYREFLGTFPLSVSGFEPTEPVVEFEWFESTEPGRRPAIVFNPILGGDYPLERGMCRYFASRGYHVALVHRKTLKISPEHPVDRIELLLRQGVIRIRQVVDWMEHQERVDASRLGSFGISMGGIATVITAAVEPRLRVHVAALAGGGIADILVGTHDSLLAKPRAKYLARNQMDLKTLDQQLRARLKTDPILLAPYVRRDALLMFIALADRTIGRANSMRLWHALGTPRVVFLPLGHYTSYFALPFLKHESLRFFKNRL